MICSCVCTFGFGPNLLDFRVDAGTQWIRFESIGECWFGTYLVFAMAATVALTARM